MPERRGLYFAFQGLLVSVLILLFLHQVRGTAYWAHGLTGLFSFTLASLIVIRMVPERALVSWWFQAGLFLADALVASASLYWAPYHTNLYLLYLMIIFGTAMTRHLSQSLLMALICSALYIGTSWSPSHGFPADSAFWLRVAFLWVVTPLLAILSMDATQIQEEGTRLYWERLTNAERLAALGHLAGEVAHRIKGPLTTIMVNAEVLSAKTRHSETLSVLAQIQEDAKRCRDILHGLLDLGRVEEMDISAIDLRQSVLSAIESIRPRLKKSRLRLEPEGLDQPIPVLGDPSMLHEAVAALLHNAVDAGPPGSCIRVQVRQAPLPWWRFWEFPRQSQARISVIDQGAGISPEEFPRIFTPFFTTKPATGSGLGLSTAMRILQKHGGTIEVDSDAGKETRFTIVIPLRAATRAEKEPTSPRSRSGRAER